MANNKFSSARKKEPWKGVFKGDSGVDVGVAKKTIMKVVKML